MRSSGSSADHVDFDLRQRATTANTLGIVSVIMCLVAPCATYMPLLFAFPLALITVHYGRSVLAEDPDEITTVYARTGLTLGVIALVYSALLLLVVAAF